MNYVKLEENLRSKGQGNGKFKNCCIYVMVNVQDQLRSFSMTITSLILVPKKYRKLLQVGSYKQNCCSLELQYVTEKKTTFNYNKSKQ